LLALACALALPARAGAAKGARKAPAQTPLDAYVSAAQARSAAPGHGPEAGSLWTPGALLSDLGRDLKASQIDDLVTIVVFDSASAVSKGSTKSSRDSAAKYSVASLAGPTKAAGALANLADLTGQQSLAGEGATTRENTLSTTLTARVTAVLPNGYLVVEGAKHVVVNSENQLVTVRGVIRPADVTPANQVRSDRLAELEVLINGKGVVGDAVRRPFILYRLLLGLLPF